MHSRNLEFVSRKFYFKTLKDIGYYRSFRPREEIKWNEPSVSKLQTSVKSFLKTIWFDDIVAEEFSVKVGRSKTLRFDFYNLTRRIVVEVMGDQHTRKIDHFHKTDEDFWKGVENDRLKELFCEKNEIRLVEIYPNNIPVNYEWLRATYSNICWPKQRAF